MNRITHSIGSILKITTDVVRTKHSMSTQPAEPYLVSVSLQLGFLEPNCRLHYGIIYFPTNIKLKSRPPLMVQLKQMMDHLNIYTGQFPFWLNQMDFSIFPDECWLMKKANWVQPNVFNVNSKTHCPLESHSATDSRPDGDIFFA